MLLAMARKPEPKQIVAAIYARSGSPDPSTTDEHVRLCREVIKANRWTLGEAYVDAGRVDTTIEARPQLMRLLADADRGVFSHVMALNSGLTCRQAQDDGCRDQSPVPGGERHRAFCAGGRLTRPVASTHRPGRTRSRIPDGISTTAFMPEASDHKRHTSNVVFHPSCSRLEGKTTFEVATSVAINCHAGFLAWDAIWNVGSAPAGAAKIMGRAFNSLSGEKASVRHSILDFPAVG